MYLTADFLIKVNNIKTVSNNITLRKVNVKPYGFNKMNIDKNLVEDKLYQITGQFNERKIYVCKNLVNISTQDTPFYDGNG